MISGPALNPRSGVFPFEVDGRPPDFYVASSGPPVFDGPRSSNTKLVAGEKTEGFGFGSWFMNHDGRSTGVMIALTFGGVVPSSNPKGVARVEIQAAVLSDRGTERLTTGVAQPAVD